MLSQEGPSQQDDVGEAPETLLPTNHALPEEVPQEIDIQDPATEPGCSRREDGSPSDPVAEAETVIAVPDPAGIAVCTGQGHPAKESTAEAVPNSAMLPSQVGTLCTECGLLLLIVARKRQPQIRSIRLHPVEMLRLPFTEAISVALDVAYLG